MEKIPNASLLTLNPSQWPNSTGSRGQEVVEVSSGRWERWYVENEWCIFESICFNHRLEFKSHLWHVVSCLCAPRLSFLLCEMG